MVELHKVFDKVLQDKIRTIPGKAKVIETAKTKGRLLAVHGNYDYVEKILPHCYAAVKVLIQPNEAPPNLRDFDVVFVGCPGKVSVSQWAKPLVSFVEVGGVLLTTDWCLANLVQPVFPQTIRQEGTAQGTFPLHVRQPGHPLLEGIASCEGTRWIVEGASHRIGILNRKAVEVILDAPTMGEPAAVLVTFPVGKGLVVHAISHFHLQGSEETGEYVSAYLVTNVIDEAIRRRHLEPLAPRIHVLDPSKPSSPPRIRIVGRR